MRAISKLQAGTWRQLAQAKQWWARELSGDLCFLAGISKHGHTDSKCASAKRAPSSGGPIFVNYRLGCDHQRVVFPLVRVDIYPNQKEYNPLMITTQ